MKDTGDFQYNGIPIFKVGFGDFHMFYDSLENNKRILSKNILNESLQEYYRKSRDNVFGICYEGVIIDLRDFRKEKFL
jgi:hypothetical protein